jgi:hypothetical protein
MDSTIVHPVLAFFYSKVCLQWYNIVGIFFYIVILCVSKYYTLKFLNFKTYTMGNIKRQHVDSSFI